MSVRVETGGLNHKLHDLGRASGGEELVGGLGPSAFEGWVRVRHVPIDVPAVYEAADKNDGTIREGFYAGIPALLSAWPRTSRCRTTDRQAS